MRLKKLNMNTVAILAIAFLVLFLLPGNEFQQAYTDTTIRHKSGPETNITATDLCSTFGLFNDDCTVSNVQANVREEKEMWWVYYQDYNTLTVVINLSSGLEISLTAKFPEQ